MSSIPGSFHSDDDSDIDMDDFARVTRHTSDSEDPDSDNSEFQPIPIDPNDQHNQLDPSSSHEDEEDDDDSAEEQEQVDDDDDDDQPPQSGGDDDDDESAAATATRGGQLRIGYDPTNGAVLLIDAQGNPRRLTSRDLQGTALSVAGIRNMLLNRFGGTTRARRGGDDDDDSDDPDYLDEFDDLDDDDDDDWTRGPKQWYELVKEPQPAGVDLERSGLFSRAPVKYSRATTKSWHVPTTTTTSTSLQSYFATREHAVSRPSKEPLGDLLIPNSSGVEVSQFTSKVYSGQYSNDGDFFYTACQDFCIYIYDTASPPRVGSKSVTDSTPSSSSSRRHRGVFGGRSSMYADWSHRTSLKTSKVVRADPSNCRWTITDAELSDDNDWLIYSSISPRSHLVKTGRGTRSSSSVLDDANDHGGGDDDEQETIDFASGFGGYGGFGIWSLRFSHDNREIVAGASDGQVMVYDVEAKRTILRVNAHRDDVNAVAFGSDSDSNLLLSGSDDCFVKVWDRRSLSGERASGVLVGHTEGITWVSPKGDGRYCITNGKDQAMKLWDLRMMTSDQEFERLRLDRKNFSSGYDYRSGYYPKPRYMQHPHDKSVMTYRGHSVVSTLIRCHWSPVSTTGQRYLYTGSADGKIHIYSLDGTTVSVLDRADAHPLVDRKTGEYNDPTEWRLRRNPRRSRGGGRRSAGGGVTVRDVSWHPERAEMMSTSWEERGQVEGSIAVHQWSGKRGETLADAIEASSRQTTT